ncbi:hypothetical protein PBV87_08890 [Niameybacter massiliensis]|uniref:Uncharacterized protein n=1 Tax=Holtiella tumoricola TaxID=3018743 RepID=A0AA42DMA1_9FIRM|nr:hypothetical protein [Holtiella tumoricola]MDA3731589.1 hypothetical protein [Holtiella tumoricola]
MARCIYCGTEYNLSESDIIPDALTNARILNRNVCKTEHNNKFSDLFEYKIISELAFLTNSLDIKSSKSSSYPKYEATYNIAGLEYPVKLSSETQLFRGKKLRSKDGKHLMGLLSDIEDIAEDPNKVEQIDINKLEIEEKIQINTSIFYSQEMFRMVSKIAYEWYCLKNDISDKYDDFMDIINFITHGIGHPVYIIEDAGIINYFRQNTIFASHCIIGYLSQDNNVYVLLSLFGAALYKVKVCKFNPQLCKNTCMLQELTINSERKEILYGNPASLLHDVQNSFIPNKIINGITVMIPINPLDTSLQQKLFLSSIYQLMESGQVVETREPTKNSLGIIMNNIEYLMNQSIIHKKALKRFVKEHIIDSKESIILNPEGTKNRNVFMFYIVYLIGKYLEEIKDIKQINQLIEGHLGKQNSEYIINDDFSVKLKERILKDKDYSVVLTQGARLIMDW